MARPPLDPALKLNRRPFFVTTDEEAHLRAELARLRSGATETSDDRIVVPPKPISVIPIIEVPKRAVSLEDVKQIFPGMKRGNFIRCQGKCARKPECGPGECRGK